MPLLNLPNEVLLMIASNIPSESSINAFTCTNRRTYDLLNTYLYQHHIRTSNHSALPWVASRGILNPLLRFLDLGANIEATLDDDRGRTALHQASLYGFLSIVLALIQRGAAIDVLAKSGSTPLHYAVRSGHEAIARVLLEQGADMTRPYPKRDRHSVLHIASEYGYIGIVRLLLERGMDVQVVDRSLRTSLYYAVLYCEWSARWYGNLTTVDLLLRNNADKNFPDRFGRSAWHAAKRNPNPIVGLLFQRDSSSTLSNLDQQRIQKALDEERV